MIENFPKPYSPYTHQTEVIHEIDTAIKSDTKFIILQAPTGSGKSLLAGTIANSSQHPSEEYIEYIDKQKIFAKDQYGQYLYAEEILDEPYFGSHTLTITKQLQQQYTSLFEDSDSLKGKVNYQCAVDDEFTCEIAPCTISTKQLKTCMSEKRCPYFNARDDALKSRFSVLNYSVFLCFPEHCKKREYIICDEASELEDELVKYFSVTIDYTQFSKQFGVKLKKLLIEDRNKARLWLTDVLGQITIRVEELKIKAKKNKSLNKASIGDLYRLKNLMRFSETIKIILQHWYDSEYVVERVPDGVNFSPLYINNLTPVIFNHAKHVILMSATIIDHKTFARTLGIKDYKYIEAASTFDPTRSPIFCPGKYVLNYANIAVNLPKAAKQAIEICKEHDNEKGIIHTHSFKITQAIQKEAKQNYRFLFREAGVNNEMLLKEHFDNKSNSVIVSPSLGYGTDLIGEHGEFQLIMKLPYLPLGTKRIKTLSQKDFEWYNMKMLIALIQMSGRCTRSKEDASKTYILDGQVVKTLKRNWNKLPSYFKNRLV